MNGCSFAITRYGKGYPEWVGRGERGCWFASISKKNKRERFKLSTPEGRFLTDKEADRALAREMTEQTAVSLRRRGYRSDVKRAPRGTRKPLLSFVYFIACDAAGAIKIGRSVTPEKRLRQLQTAHPSPLKLLGCIPGGSAFERALHGQLSGARLHGEWFGNTQDVRSVINGHLNQRVMP